METKHTPGPWVFEGENSAMPVLCLYCADNKSPFHGSRNEEELKANARLIAAAPELLEALCEATAWLHAHKHTLCAQSICDQVDAAIAKATGEKA